MMWKFIDACAVQYAHLSLGPDGSRDGTLRYLKTINNHGVLAMCAISLAMATPFLPDRLQPITLTTIAFAVISHAIACKLLWKFRRDLGSVSVNLALWFLLAAIVIDSMLPATALTLLAWIVFELCFLGVLMLSLKITHRQGDAIREMIREGGR